MRAFLIVALVFLAGCAAAPTLETTEKTEGPKTLEQKDTAEPIISEVTVTESPKPSSNTIDLDVFADNAVSGGVRKDGIPSIDEPQFVSAEEADEWLSDDDVVFGLAIGDDVRAYPQIVLVWHEIVNDVVAGLKLAVTYCPLTGTAIVFKLPEMLESLGVSGKLVNSNLIMYDRATDSYWPQILGTAVSGEHKGERLEELPIIWTTWARWKKKYPDTKVLSTKTGHLRRYGKDPYGSYTDINKGYYESPSVIFQPLHADTRLGTKDVVVGVRSADHIHAIAVLKDRLREQKVINAELDGRPITFTYDEELDTAKVFIRNADGTRGNRLNAFDAMWFAWAGFYPETELIK